MKKKIKLIEFWIINWKVDKETFLKITNYFIFSSLSILCGFFYINKRVEVAVITKLLFFLPIFYFYNFLYFQIWQLTRTWILPHLTWFSDKIRDHIFGCHALLLNLILTFIIYKCLLAETFIVVFNMPILILLLLYSILFFLRRTIKELDKKQNLPLFSILKYESHKHSHIFAASVIAIPFLIGLSATKNMFEAKELIVNGILAYIFYIFSWIALYQYKYKLKCFLENFNYLIPLALYPVFPILFYLIFRQDLLFFYILLVIILFLYFSPLLYRISRNKSVFEKLANEKLILTIILSVLAYFSWFPEVSVEIEKQYPFKDLTIIFFSSIAGIVLGFRRFKCDDYKKYMIVYSVLPYFFIITIHFVGWIVFGHFGFSIGRIQPHINLLSKQLFMVEHCYVILFILISVYITFKKTVA